MARTSGAGAAIELRTFRVDANYTVERRQLRSVVDGDGVVRYIMELGTVYVVVLRLTCGVLRPYVCCVSTTNDVSAILVILGILLRLMS